MGLGILSLLDTKLLVYIHMVKSEDYGTKNKESCSSSGSKLKVGQRVKRLEIEAYH